MRSEGTPLEALRTALVAGLVAGLVAMLFGASAGGQGADPIRLDSSPWSGPRFKSGTGFGTSVAASDHRILVGVPHDHAAGWHAGAVYVFERVGPLWLPAARWTAEDALPFHQFGHTVAITADGRTGFAAAWQADGAVPTSGAVYVFERDATRWRQVAKLYSSDGAPNDGFGSALAVDADRLVVGACYADQGAFQAGSAFVFEALGGTWVETEELAPSEAGFLAGFGCSAALVGDRIAIGAPRADTAGTDSGAVFVFEHDGAGWSQREHFAPSGIADGAAFGAALALSDDTLAIGSPGAEVAGVRSGTVTVLAVAGSTWTLGAELRLMPPAPGAAFGSALGLRGDTLIAGAPGLLDAGAVLRFADTSGEWSLTGTLVAPDGRAGDGFGAAVATSLTDAVCGAPATDLPTADDPGAGRDVGLVWVGTESGQLHHDSPPDRRRNAGGRGANRGGVVLTPYRPY